MIKIGFTAGAWDLLHAGHVLLLEQAKERCDWLFVGLHVDPSVERLEKNKPVQSLYERFLQLKGCKYVDEVIPYETEDELITILKTQDISIRFLGDDYLEQDFTGKEVCSNKGIEFCYLPRSHNYSSSELRQRIKGESK